MLNFSIGTKVALWAITLFFAALSLPSLVSVAGGQWPSGLPDPEVNLGLDLAGGSHILLEADSTQVGRQRLETMEESVRANLRNAEPRIRHGDISTRDGRLTFLLEDPTQVDAAREAILPLVDGAGLTGQRDWNIEVVDTSRFVITQTQAGLDQAINTAMDSATEVVRSRIDALGTREPTIIRQGEQRIVVQVPGLEDPEQLKELIGTTAQLEFKLVDGDALPTDVAQGLAPPGSQIVPYAGGTDFEGQSIAVRRLGGIRGDSLTSASAGKDPQNNQDVVNIRFDNQGAARFAKLTRENVNKPFAIILDGKVLSAPNINEPIQGGQAQISGSFNAESAKQLAIQLSAGALPVDLTVVEERTVGPDLGRDSIQKGVLAMGIGSLLVIALMIATYGRFGVYAVAALVLNVLMVLGVMALGGFTLTLPGIAGFVLTVGSAVDANVLINERIREEFNKRNRKVMSAVETGYREASRAIFDANITNAIAAVLLLNFGSGPIKGFAIVLLIGLVSSVFTAVVLTRMWVAGWLRAKRPTSLSL